MASFFKVFRGLTVRYTDLSVGVWDLFVLFDASELLPRKKQWMDPLLLLPCHFQFHRCLSYPPCGMSSILDRASTFDCFLSSGHSAAFIILVTLLHAFCICISVWEVGSEPGIRAMWIYALMQSSSLLSQWFLTFNLLFSSVNCSLSWGFHYLLYYLCYLSGYFVTYTVLSRSSSWCSSELGDHHFKCKVRIVGSICFPLHLLTLNFTDQFVTQQFTS